MGDVAKSAGVSTASVSRALSGARPVRSETFQRVIAAVKELDYKVNPMASALRGKVTRTVGMVVPDIVNPFFPAVVKAVEDALHRSGMSLFLCDSNDSPEVEADRLEALLARSVDGLIISPVDAVKSRAAVAAASKRVPLVQIDRHVNVGSDMVLVDHSRGIQLVLEHLIELGCCSFAFVTTRERSSIANERLQAYVRCVRPIDPKSASRVLAGDLSIAWGKEAGMRLVGGRCPQAVVCANDLVAVGVLQTFRMQGIRVPEDVAVTGYDDSLFADVVEPRLTTVRQPLGVLGQEAVRFIISAIESPSSPRRELRLLPELVVRASSGNARRRSRTESGEARILRGKASNVRSPDDGACPTSPCSHDPVGDVGDV
jgi:LacI family transcriptional regulator